MPRLPPRTDVLRALFARSGNKCTFPGCTAPLVNEKNQFVAQVCHIEAAEKNGERYNKNQSDEQRRGYENLILLCYPHHVETNDVVQYTTKRLFAIKAEHEKSFGQKLFQIDESLLHKVSLEMGEYWRHVDFLHREHHVASDLAIEINAAVTFIDITDKAVLLVKDLSDIQNFLIESDNRVATSNTTNKEKNLVGVNNFEILCIGFTNTITKLSVALSQMEIKYLEEFLKLNPSDLTARQRLERRKEEFAEYATNAGHAD